MSLVQRKRRGIRALLLLLSSWLSSQTNSFVRAAEFNNEIAKRVEENLRYFMSMPLHATGLTRDYFELRGFPLNLRAPDRSTALRYLYSQARQLKANTYVALEDGTWYGFNAGFRTATYREPGEGGYVINDNNNNTVREGDYKHWISCVHQTTGAPTKCRQPAGAKYIQWDNKTALEPCDNQPTEEDCRIWASMEAQNSTLGVDYLLQECVADITYCRAYQIATVAPNETRGFVPRTYNCIDSEGQFSEDIDRIVSRNASIPKDRRHLGNCTFGDGTTLVQRTDALVGTYAYCGPNNTTPCHGTFTGGYRSRDYDPRYRQWYLDVKSSQRKQWSSAYPFFTTNEMGISHSEPLFLTIATNHTMRKVFEGVVIVDYELTDIANFLVEAYNKSDTNVILYEDAEPHYIIAASSGATAAKQVLKHHNSLPCPFDAVRQSALANSHCQSVRVPMDGLEGNDKDRIFRLAYSSLKAQGFPKDQLIRVHDPNGPVAYAARSQIYEQPNANMRWQLVIVVPIERSQHDSTLPGDALFGVVCALAGLGFLVVWACRPFVIGYERNGRLCMPIGGFSWPLLGVVPCSICLPFRC